MPSEGDISGEFLESACFVKVDLARKSVGGCPSIGLYGLVEEKARKGV